MNFYQNGNGHNSYIRPKKIVILGAGDIGEKVWAHLTAGNVAENITVWNRSDKAEVDLFDGKSSARDQSNIVLGIDGSSTAEFPYNAEDKTHFIMGRNKFREAVADADIIINTMGVARVRGDNDRDKLFNANYDIIHDYAKDIAEAAPNATVINATNPVDTLTQALVEEGGFDKNRVVGLGGELDRSRLFQAVAIAKKLPHEAIDWDSTMVIGQHGKAMIPVLSQVKDTHGNLLFPESKSPDAMQVAHATIQGGDILTEKLGKSDGEAPAAAIYKMVKALINAKNGKSSTIYASAYDSKDDVFIGRPITFQEDGTYKTEPLPKLSPTEQIAWQKALDICKDGMNKVPTHKAYVENAPAPIQR